MELVKNVNIFFFLFHFDIFLYIFQDYDAQDLNEFKNSLLAGCDVNRDGKISKNELKLVLLSVSNK